MRSGSFSYELVVSFGIKAAGEIRLQTKKMLFPI